MTWTSLAMPRSFSSLAAFSMTSRSDSDPITMPTRTPSSPPNSVASTSVCVSGCVTLCPLHRAQRDVRSHLLSVELNLLGGRVGAPPCVGRRLAEARDVQDAPAGGDDVVALERRAGVEHLGLERVDRTQALDHVALRCRLRVAAGGEHDGNGPQLLPVELEALEPAGRDRALERVEQVGAQPRQDRLCLGVAEAGVELQD